MCYNVFEVIFTKETTTNNNIKSFLNTKSKYIFQAFTEPAFTSHLHTHTFYEFICVISGSCVHVSDGITYEMQANDYVLLCPGNSHQLLRREDSASVLCISISKDEFQKYRLLFGDALVESPSVPVHLSVSVFDILKELVTDSNNPTHNEIRAVCSSLFANFCDITSKKDLLCPRLSYMTEELLKNPDLLQSGIKAMTALSCYSEAQLGRLTKKYYQASPHTYLKQLRLQKAWQYILQTDLPLEEISLLCGYNCYGYFTNIFKDKYGLSPSMLRKTKN